MLVPPRLATAAALVALVLAASPAVSDPPAPARPLDLGLERPTGGTDALRALGADLDRAAAVNGLPADRLRSILRTDPTAHVASSGRLFYRDVQHEPVRPAVVPLAPYPDTDTFRLHSLPGAQRTVFIDFDGTSVTGTLWNQAEGGGLEAGTVDGFSLDGSPAFSSAELALVQEVWQRVAEDFAPFGVDVTTEQPPAGDIDRVGDGDQRYGTTAVVTGDARAHERLCRFRGCTGIAAVDVFDLAGTGYGSHAFYQPAWAFTAHFKNVKSIADTVSHEVGHNLGLSHWGTEDDPYYRGHGSWFPIMGSSTLEVGQWSRGSYPGAVTDADDGGPQDDVTVIAGNGAPVRVDDVGDTVARAGTLPIASGVISTRADRDVYALGPCTGQVSVTGATAYANPNLDIELSLLDASGQEVASADPTGLSATVSYAATGSPLFVAVDGVGAGTFTTGGYDDYGSLGSYRLTRTGSCGAGSGDPDPEPDPDAPTAPGALASLTAVWDAAGAQAVVSWTPPTDDGGSPVTGYQLRLDGRLLETVEADYTGAYLPAADFGLAPGSRHTVEVCAVNATADRLGCGPATTASFTRPATVPGAPRIGRAAPGAAGGARTAVVTWSAPGTGGAAIASYVVTASRYSGSRIVATRTFTVRASVRRGDVPVGAGVWRFRVRAVNAVGPGAASALSNAVTAR